MVEVTLLPLALCLVSYEGLNLRESVWVLVAITFEMTVLVAEIVWVIVVVGVARVIYLESVMYKDVL